MTPEMILQRARVAGVLLAITPAGGVKARGDRERVNRLVPLFREYKKGLIHHLLKTVEVRYYPKPYLVNDELRIPNNCYPKYKWWMSGQTVLATLQELEASDKIIEKYCEKKLD